MDLLTGLSTSTRSKAPSETLAAWAFDHQSNPRRFSVSFGSSCTVALRSVKHSGLGTPSGYGDFECGRNSRIRKGGAYPRRVTVPGSTGACSNRDEARLSLIAASRNALLRRPARNGGHNFRYRRSLRSATGRLSNSCGTKNATTGSDTVCERSHVLQAFLHLDFFIASSCSSPQFRAQCFTWRCLDMVREVL